jgi:hypothetical protein
MGEIADMMLDGTMCQGCGEFLHDTADGFPGADGPGYPMYCSACQPDDEPQTEVPRRTRRSRSETFFPCVVLGCKKKFQATMKCEAFFDHYRAKHLGGAA